MPKEEDGLADDMQHFNLPEEYLRRYRVDADYEIHHECWDAFELFQSCATQWRTGEAGMRIGLDYSAVVAVAGVYGIADRVNIDYVRYLELGALASYMGKDLEYVLDGR